MPTARARVRNRVMVSALFGLMLSASLPAAALAGRTFSWFLIEGPFVGDRLRASSGEAPAAVAIADNEVNEAQGVISPAEAGCQPPAVGTHFHGSMYGMPDPNPTGCGWGRVVRNDESSVEALSRAIREEVEAAEELDSPFPRLRAARRDVRTALRKLDEAEREVVRLEGGGRIDSQESAEIRDALEAARALDREALSALDRGDEDSALQMIRDAIEAKRVAVQRLFAALL